MKMKDFSGMTISILALLTFWVLCIYPATGFCAITTCSKQLTLPDYDPGNPEMRLVNNLAELNTALADDIRIIFVAPGEYFADGNLVLTLSTSGTEIEPRYLLYHKPTDPTDQTHPVHMAPSDRAVFKIIRILGASYWVLDRLTVSDSVHESRVSGLGDPARSDTNDYGSPLDTGTAGPFTPAQHNTFNRMLFENIAEDVLHIYDQSNYTTIQNSVIRNTPLPEYDYVAIDLMAWRGQSGSAEVVGTCIANNEIYNVNDGVQFFHHTIIENEGLVPDYRGTTIVNNDFYITPDYYSDCNGNLTPDGTCSASENAIDMKSASLSSAPSDWVRIEQNRMWGYRFLDQNLAGSNDHGWAVVVHYANTAGCTLFKDNVIMDTVNGITIANQHHISIIGNIFYDIKRLGHDGTSFPYEQSAPLWLQGSDHEVYNNLLIQGDMLWTFTSQANNLDFINNLVLDFPSYYLPSHTGLAADYNAYYNSPQLAQPGTHDTVSPSSVVPGHTTKTIIRKRITSREIVTIPYGEIGTESPLAQTPTSVGSRVGVGVDDVLVSFGGTTTEMPPAVILTASPPSITAGGSTTLTWNSTDTTTCIGTGFLTGGTTSGSASVSPVTDTAYTVDCDGATDSVLVMVDAIPEYSLPWPLFLPAIENGQR